MQDIILKNGLICDGTGAPAYVGDVWIKDGKITRVGLPQEEPCAQEVDCTGLAVAPGFVDIHSHSDTVFLIDGKCEGKLYQGVTSELSGQCGSTIYPCAADRMDNLRAYVGSSKQYDASYYTSASLGEFVSKLKERDVRISVNQLPLIGHGALRAGVMGFDGRKAAPEELKLMCSLMDQQMKDGAWGMSLGLGYAPGIFADQEELNALGEVVSRYDGLITSHMRNQGEHIYDALEEMYEINRKTGARVHIAHLKMSYKKHWGTAWKVAEHLEKARGEGVAVTADMYPYRASSSGITNILPKWSLDGGIPMAAKRLEEGGEEADKMMAALQEYFQTEEDGEGVFIVSTHGSYPPANGKTILDLGREWNLSMPDAARELILRTRGSASCIFFSMADEDVNYLLARNEIAIGSDGSCYPLDEKANEGKLHPRNFGTFPRFLRLCRENQWCDLATAVHRITGKSAGIIGLADRGILKEGLVADVTVFDPRRIADTATYQEPFQKPEGICHVIMNGQFALKDGSQTENRLGSILLKGQK